jgi:hypothetical protein
LQGHPWVNNKRLPISSGSIAPIKVIHFCKKRSRLTEDNAEALDAPHGAWVAIPKAPFSDEEVQRIYAGFDRIGVPTKPGPVYRAWSGEDAIRCAATNFNESLRIILAIRPEQDKNPKYKNPECGAGPRRPTGNFRLIFIPISDN